MQVIFAYGLQITSCKQETVNRSRIALNFRIDNRSIDIRGYRLPLHQLAQVIGRFIISFRNNLADDTIIAGGLPICFWEAVVIEIVDYRPGIKDILCLLYTSSVNCPVIKLENMRCDRRPIRRASSTLASGIKAYRIRLI